MTFEGSDPNKLPDMRCDSLYDGDHIASLGQIKLGGGF